MHSISAVGRRGRRIDVCEVDAFSAALGVNRGDCVRRLLWSGATMESRRLATAGMLLHCSRGEVPPSRRSARW